jgi:hypothetical protein
MMANRVRPGIETLRQMSGTSSPQSRMERVSAEPIKASGMTRRINRPDTRLLLTTSPQTQKVLEKQEPSTQDIPPAAQQVRLVPEAGIGRTSTSPNVCPLVLVFEYGLALYQP